MSCMLLTDAARDAIEDPAAHVIGSDAVPIPAAILQEVIAGRAVAPAVTEGRAGRATGWGEVRIRTDTGLRVEDGLNKPGSIRGRQ